MRTDCAESSEVIIHIQWDGLHPLNSLSQLNNESRDYGVYQVYGYHPTYGSDSLLYIGQANQQTFYTRISQENWELEEREFNFFVGRLADVKQPTDNAWSKRIDLAEKFLIYAHFPAYNSRGLQSIPGKEFMYMY